MSDNELLAYGRAARHMCSPDANLGKPPREVFVVQLKEARAEWRRRHPKGGHTDGPAEGSEEGTEGSAQGHRT